MILPQKYVLFHWRSSSKEWLARPIYQDTFFKEQGKWNKGKHLCKAFSQAHIKFIMKVSVLQTHMDLSTAAARLRGSGRKTKNLLITNGAALPSRMQLSRSVSWDAAPVVQQQKPPQSWRVNSAEAQLLQILSLALTHYIHLSCH